MIWFILVIALVLRLINLDQSLWLDEAINVLATKNFTFFGMITEYAKYDFHPPGYFIILWLWTKMFGISEIVVRIPSVIFGALTIYIVYLIGNKLHSKTLGILASFLLAVNPLHIFYSQEARMYALAALAVSINVFLFIKLVKGEKFNLIFLIISNILVLTSDYVAYLIFPAQFVFLVLTQRKIIIRWGIAFFVAILSGFWWIPTLLNQFDVGAVASANLPAWKFIVGGFDVRAVPLTFVKFIIGRISLADKFVYGLILLPIGILFLFLIWRGIRFIKVFQRNLLISLIVIPVILATVISLVVPIYSYVRLLYILPVFVLLIALGIISFKSQLRYIFLTAVFLVFFISSLIYLFNPSFQREDWKGVMSFLTKQDVLVLFESSGTLPPFDYYAKGSINARGALKDFPAKEKEDLADLAEITKNQQNLYLLEYLVDISDPGRLVEKKLDELGFSKKETKDFTGVGFIHHYIKYE